MSSLYDICQYLRGGSKQTYLGGAPPNTPPCSQWGALIYAGTPGDSKRCQKGTWLPLSLYLQHHPSGLKPWFSLLLTQGGVFGGMPPRYVCFVISLKSWHRWIFLGWQSDMGRPPSLGGWLPIGLQCNRQTKLPPGGSYKEMSGWCKEVQECELCACWE